MAITDVALQGKANNCAFVLSDHADTGAMWASLLHQQQFYVATADLTDSPIDLSVAPRCNIILISISAPQTSMLSLIEQLRRQTEAPILLMSSFYDEVFLAQAFEHGADDALFGPVSPRLLMLKIRAWLRRVKPQAGLFQPLREGQVKLDPTRRIVMTRHGKSIRLTYLEYRLLFALMSEAGSVVEAQELARRVWGYVPGDNTLLKNLVYRLRQKLEDDPSQPTVILSVPRHGYSFNIS